MSPPKPPQDQRLPQPRIVVVGARSHRQGTGPFIAAGLAAAGANVCAIVGTSSTSVDLATSDLEHQWGITSKGYTDLSTALQSQQPDAVAICSPWRFHAEQLAQVAAAGCHCLVEKPMAWPADDKTINALLKAYTQRELLLQMVTQWPTALPEFAKLHGGIPSVIKSFAMRLSPISIGADMITDSAPHFISMLQALAGPGDFVDCSIAMDESEAADSLLSLNGLSLNGVYRHDAGEIAAQLLLQTGSERPRPAWFQINELRADREVELPEYQQHLVNGDRRVALPDPMHQVTSQFVRALSENQQTNTYLLQGAHRNLQQLDTVWNNRATSTVVENRIAP